MRVFDYGNDYAQSMKFKKGPEHVEDEGVQVFREDRDEASEAATGEEEAEAQAEKEGPPKKKRKGKEHR